jgi:two-component system, response regulator, stage 0 sporulation protein F
MSKSDKAALKRVLLVDDDTGQLESLGKCLNYAGFMTFTCEDGDEAIAAMEGFPIDIMICDVQMPRVNGLSVLKWVKENRPELKVILMTAFSSYELYQIATDNGAVMYMEKPIDPKLLVEILRSPISEIAGRDEVVNACLEASKKDGDGEVVVRSKDAVGRVYFSDGKVAWATHTSGSNIFMSLLKKKTGLEKVALEKTVELCRRAGLNIIDTIIEKEVVDRKSMEDILLRSIAHTIGEMLVWRPCKALYLPVARSYEGTISFRFDDILEYLDKNSAGSK